MGARVMRSGAIVIGLLGTPVLGFAGVDTERREISPARLTITAQAMPASPREPVPELLVRGQLTLTAHQRQQVRERIQQAAVQEQPVPRAFAPAVGMTAPPELKLTPLPHDIRQLLRVGEQHQLAILTPGTILIVGEERLVVAMIGAEERAPQSSAPRQGQ